MELINTKAELNYQNNDGLTALMLASLRGLEKIVTKLIENGADPNMKTSDGKTALSFASESGNEDIIEFLSSKTQKSDL